MQVKTEFHGKPPKLRWGYNLFFPIFTALLTIGCTIGELSFGMPLSLILSTFVIGCLLTLFFLYVSEGYTMTAEGLFYSTLLGKRKLLIAWKDVQELYRTMRLVDICPPHTGAIPYKTYSECIIVTSKKLDRLLTYAEAVQGYNDHWCFAFAYSCLPYESAVEGKVFSQKTLFDFFDAIGLPIADRTHEHPYWHDPALRQKLFVR